jgi:DNA-binding PadR family transcriptional regulator
MTAPARGGDLERIAAIKPMTSQVNWAVLGLLIDRPSYGYQLMQRFADAYGDELPLRSDSHIYTALNELKRRGLIEEAQGIGTLLSGTDRQPRPSYRATREGIHEYREWMLAQVGEDRRRSRLFVRQLAVFASEPEAALAILERYEQGCLSEASHAPMTPAEDSPVNPVTGLATRLLSEESRLAMEAKLPWVEYARETFRDLAGRGDEPT